MRRDMQQKINNRLFYKETVKIIKQWRLKTKHLTRNNLQTISMAQINKIGAQRYFNRYSQPRTTTAVNS
ncbi:hypothetical protein EGH51_19325 [Klebsiella aerogenes]|nr:hypothetical protein AM345_15925 [Klebsiella aerogenes]KHM36842.1 hypothetical protein KV34_02625 [Klebsiella aerogenes]KZQ51910.1 hypothetical protein A3N43_03185 [Klebsiella aerogenes]RNT21842.1 hypothetical protein B9031_024070 [Klebsiella aerogenes]RSW00336.1 hypothetical protein EGH51_19325 [Klebsiella aerogenes]